MLFGEGVLVFAGDKLTAGIDKEDVLAFLVELHEPVIFHQQRTVQGVAPLNPDAVDAVQEHVHVAERPCTAVGFLSEEGKVRACS